MARTLAALFAGAWLAASVGAWAFEPRLVRSADDVAIAAGDGSVHSLRDTISAEVRESYAPAWPFVDYEVGVRIIGAAGPFLSLAETHLRANPATYITERASVRDLRRQASRVRLTGLFADRALRAAILSHPTLRRALRDAGWDGRRGSVDELAARLVHSVPGRQGDLYFPPDWLESFAIVAVGRQQVSIAIALPRLAGNREERAHWIRLDLPRSSVIDPALFGPAPYLPREAGTGYRQAFGGTRPGDVVFAVHPIR